MDNPYSGWSPLPRRPPLRWPDDARVAVCAVVAVEQAEWLPPAGVVLPPSLVRFGPYPEVFDVHEVSVNAYGNRVGVFRVLEALRHHGLRATAAVDAATIERCPPVLERLLADGAELLGRGLSASRMISEQMSEDEEREFIETSLEAVERASGASVRGWFGADYGESSRTPRLLAERGVRYVCDWPNDEQPNRLRVPQGELFSLPIAFELDDVVVMRERGVPVGRWLTMVIESFDRLYEDGAQSGRVLALALHPYLVGQPFRIRYLERALAHIAARDDVWLATGGEIVDWYATTAT
jgi:peptidoglycan/xylan/chitin deacetylase (PgdA/CDA1 family)